MCIAGVWQSCWRNAGKGQENVRSNQSPFCCFCLIVNHLFVGPASLEKSRLNYTSNPLTRPTAWFPARIFRKQKLMYWMYSWRLPGFIGLLVQDSNQSLRSLDWIKRWPAKHRGCFRWGVLWPWSVWKNQQGEAWKIEGWTPWKWKDKETVLKRSIQAFCTSNFGSILPSSFISGFASYPAHSNQKREECSSEKILYSKRRL